MDMTRSGDTISIKSRYFSYPSDTCRQPQQPLRWVADASAGPTVTRDHRLASPDPPGAASEPPEAPNGANLAPPAHTPHGARSRGRRGGSDAAPRPPAAAPRLPRTPPTPLRAAAPLPATRTRARRSVTTVAARTGHRGPRSRASSARRRRSATGPSGGVVAENIPPLAVYSESTMKVTV